MNIALSFYFLKPDYNNTKYKGKVEIIDIDGKYYVGKLLNVNPKKKVLLKNNKESLLKPGDVIIINSEIEFAQSSRNYGGFNYRRYLYSKKIYGIIEIQNYKKIDVRKDIYYYLGNVRLKCFEILDDEYDTKERSFLKSILLGYKNDLEEDIKEDFRKSSLSHIIAISGMHISYVMIFLETLFKMTSLHKKVKNIIEAGILMIFMIFIGMTPSCVRACLMFSYALLGKSIDRKPNHYIGMLLSLVIIVGLNVYNIFNIGLWLSFLSTLGIICLSRLINRMLIRKIGKDKMQYFTECFSVSFASQLFIFPITIKSYNSFSSSFFIPNFLVSIFIGPTIILGYMSILLSIIRPVSTLIVLVEKILISIILSIAKYGGKLPFSSNQIITPNWIIIIVYYFIVMLILRYSYKNRIGFIRIILRNPIKAFSLHKKLPIKIVISFTIIVIITSQVLPMNNRTLKIYFIDVGQGDSCLIKTPQNKTILIDGGDGGGDKYDYGKNVLFPYLMDRRIRKLDYIIISHFDSDHIGGLFYIIENMRVENAIISVQGEISENLIKLQNIVQKKHIKVLTKQKGEVIQIENDICIDFLWPNSTELLEENVLNNNSIVCKLKYNSFTMLFTGDIEEIAEKQILQEYGENTKLLKSTILKVAHHGSRTSSTEEFLKAVTPQIALIGVGEKNKFGHPNDEVIKRLEALRSKNI